MSKMEHSSGPWIAEKRRGDEWWFGGRDGAEIVIRSAGDEFGAVAVLGAKLGSEGIDDANARLISAAPDLLEALQDLLDLAVGHDLPCSDPERIAAREAIAKALGTTEVTR